LSREEHQDHNVSHGLKSAYGAPGVSSYIRSKINSAVDNGILVVAAAGNGAEGSDDVTVQMADPGRAAAALTVGAVNDEGALTAYSAFGFLNPRPNAGEDFKPDVVAPGGSWFYSSILSAESNTSDGKGADKVPNDYTNISGTSLSAAFVSGCAALVIDALQQRGIPWTFGSSDQPRYVKMLLCATASETNAQRESKQVNPTLDRAGPGPDGFPTGKDRQEGYGLINPDAAVEAISQPALGNAAVTADLGGDATAKRVWARMVNLQAGRDITASLTNPAGADFDLYLYSTVPGKTGAPVILTSSTAAKAGDPESLHYSPTADGTALLVVKRVSGSGTFILRLIQAGPPLAADVQARCPINTSTTITLTAVDDGQPNPPGALSYTILSLPAQGRLESTAGTPITEVPAQLPSDKVVYQAPAAWAGQDSFTFCADDGGTPPLGGTSNTAPVTVTVVNEVTVEYQVADSADDGSIGTRVYQEYGKFSEPMQSLVESRLYAGQYNNAMRFTRVQIPQGVTILHAALKICARPDGNPAAGVNGTVRGEAVDNAPQFNNWSHQVNNLHFTTALVVWDWPWTSPPWTANVWYESPDIHAIVQEIVNRPGWAAGNSMVIAYASISTTWIYYFEVTSCSRTFWAFDGDPTKAAKLVITYQPK
jgi:hypothetical protein